ncbi:MAG: LysR family transcriptional regulator [Pseudomonadota bacterium]
MNFRALRTFLVIVESGNLNKAADRLNVTQSTVTARLDALEASLGQTLLVRSRKGAQLTRAGFIFRPYAETLLRGWEQSQTAVGLAKGFSGLFSFACEYGLWDSVGRQYFDRVRQANPGLAHEAWPGSPDEIATWLANGLTDAALTMEPVVGHGVTSSEAGRERLVLISSEKGRALSDMAGYIYVDLGPEFRRDYTNDTRFAARAAVTYASSSWGRDHLLRDGGVAYLPWGAVMAEVADGVLFAVEDAPEFSRALHFTCRDQSGARFAWLNGSKAWLAEGTGGPV